MLSTNVSCHHKSFKKIRLETREKFHFEIWANFDNSKIFNSVIFWILSNAGLTLVLWPLKQAIIRVNRWSLSKVYIKGQFSITIRTGQESTNEIWGRDKMERQKDSRDKYWQRQTERWQNSRFCLLLSFFFVTADFLCSSLSQISFVLSCPVTMNENEEIFGFLFNVIWNFNDDQHCLTFWGRVYYFLWKYLILSHFLNLKTLTEDSMA
jgi:hypothetical protein